MCVWVSFKNQLPPDTVCLNSDHFLPRGVRLDGSPWNILVICHTVLDCVKTDNGQRHGQISMLVHSRRKEFSFMLSIFQWPKRLILKECSMLSIMCIDSCWRYFNYCITVCTNTCTVPRSPGYKIGQYIKCFHMHTCISIHGDPEQCHKVQDKHVVKWTSVVLIHLNISDKFHNND